jgi:NADH dehydrogenase
MKRVVIVGGGFAGINCARLLGNRPDLKVVLLDRRNYHLFQPLLYQVAMAGLSPCDIATPIRGLMSRFDNMHVIQGEVNGIDVHSRLVYSSAGAYGYDYLVLATGAQHAYFGQEHWEPHAPGLKTLEQATEIRRRVLSAFERAECEPDANRRRALLTFVVVGGGPTGVELAGAIGEMSRFTLARDFRNIDPKLTRIVLVEAGPRILPAFDPALASRATRELEQLGVQLWTHARVAPPRCSGRLGCRRRSSGKISVSRATRRGGCWSAPTSASLGAPRCSSWVTKRTVARRAPNARCRASPRSRSSKASTWLEPYCPTERARDESPSSFATRAKWPPSDAAAPSCSAAASAPPASLPG